MVLRTLSPLPGLLAVASLPVVILPLLKAASPGPPLRAVPLPHTAHMSDCLARGPGTYYITNCVEAENSLIPFSPRGTQHTLCKQQTLNPVRFC